MSRRSDHPIYPSSISISPTEAQGWLALLDAVAGWMRRNKELARQRRALALLDDRLLRDVGLTPELAERETGRRFR